MKKTIHIIALFALAAGIQGCQLLDRDYSRTEEILIETAAKTATIELIKGDAARKAKVIETVGAAKDAIADGVIDLVELKSIVEGEIEIKQLSPTESLLLNQLLALIGEQINAEAINENRIIRLTQILTWIEEAAATSV